MGGTPMAVLFCACRVYSVHWNHGGTQNGVQYRQKLQKKIHEFFMIRGPSDWTCLGAYVII